MLLLRRNGSRLHVFSKISSPFRAVILVFFNPNGVTI